MAEVINLRSLSTWNNMSKAAADWTSLSGARLNVSFSKNLEWLWGLDRCSTQLVITFPSRKLAGWDGSNEDGVQGRVSCYMVVGRSVNQSWFVILFFLGCDSGSPPGAFSVSRIKLVLSNEMKKKEKKEASAMMGSMEGSNAD
jgi:hypothetical protein